MQQPTAPRNSRLLSVFWSRLLTRRVQYVLDILVLCGAFWLAYLLRFDFQIPGRWQEQMYHQFPYVVCLQFAALAFSGAYDMIWRYVGMAEIKVFFKGALYSTVPLLVIRFGLADLLSGNYLPLSVIAIDIFLAFGGVMALRLLRRALYERNEQWARRRTRRHRKAIRTLLVGAGRAGVLAISEIRGRGDLNMEILGFVDDDPTKQRHSLRGIEIVGTTSELPSLVRKLAVDQVIITIAEASRQQLRRIVKACESVPVRARIIPGYYELLRGSVQVSQFRDIDIEDLLGREAVALDEKSISQFIRGKCVMVTGAGGSIGSELCRQILRFAPRKLLLCERAEFALFQIDGELRQKWPSANTEALVADVGDVPCMTRILGNFEPQVIFHAAAHKHVPLMELNPFEAIKNNFLGTWTLAKLAGTANVDKFILISTDKAVEPKSVMGATKRLAELGLQELQGQFETSFFAVRFGNVLGSTGSVVPIFRQQIRSGGPVTVTHPEMSRYFMTIPEATQLVLQAATMGNGGEIFVLDMGEPIRILDLARDMIRLSGLEPDKDIEIVFTGIRPGEKLAEKLETRTDKLQKTVHPKLLMGQFSRRGQRLQQTLPVMKQLLASGQKHELLNLISELLPDAELLPKSGQTSRSSLTPTSTPSAPTRLLVREAT